MATKDHHDHHDVDPATLQESSDVDVPAILKFTIGLMVVTVIIYIALAGLYKIFDKLTASYEPTPYPMAAERPKAPPLPRLQGDPIAELQQFRAKEAESIKTGTVDAKTPGIPIDQAIEQLLQQPQNLPVRQATEGQTFSDQAEKMPSDSSSGRVFERRLR
jgi:hypothetical protein